MDTLKALQGAKRVYLDTNCFIYFLEQHPDFFSVVLPIFERGIEGQYRLVTSELTLAELLVRPYQLGRSDVAMTYRDFLLDTELISLEPITLGALDKAAATKAAHRTTLPDAIHISTALEQLCDVFVTNDRKMKGTGSLQMLYLS
ncbi:type II toxin-antitoxin system VapC family toxin [uncultured Acinetobacter sp.]|jgi:predicted nucleic acid-binding protein|uniref:type II toxin-antitoxin system VapC family toxin n=1 Tax=uncultured Acinetobacter sp. TaxID=165433 RepID=UPI00261E1C73|nr:type II toxin-antitoxin system VapC family toxin [uncultured Acinetobacter sp.]